MGGAAARHGGHISVIGVLSGHQAPIPTTLIMAKQLRLTGIQNRAAQVAVVIPLLFLRA